MSDGAAEERTPRRSRSGDVDPVRASVTILLFVGAVIVMLGWFVPRHSTSSAPTTTSTTTFTRPVDPSQTNVQVANGTSAPNAAGEYTSKLAPFGWVMRPAVDARVSSPVAKTMVYFLPSWQPAARRVALQLKLNPATTVTVRTAQTLRQVPGAARDQVVVIIGQDLASG